MQATNYVFIYSFSENLILSLMCSLLSLLFTNGHKISLQFFYHIVLNHKKNSLLFAAPYDELQIRITRIDYKRGKFPLSPKTFGVFVIVVTALPVLLRRHSGKDIFLLEKN
jgi:hypothetical protein